MLLWRSQTCAFGQHSQSRRCRFRRRQRYLVVCFARVMRASMKLVLLGPFVKHMFARWFCDRRGLFSGCARARGQAVETPPPQQKAFWRTRVSYLALCTCALSCFRRAFGCRDGALRTMPRAMRSSRGYTYRHIARARRRSSHGGRRAGKGKTRGPASEYCFMVDLPSARPLPRHTATLLR